MLIAGSLNKVPKSVVWEDIIISESQWFSVDETSAYKALNFAFDNEYEIKNKAKSLMHVNKKKFAHKKMTELLNNIVDKYIDSSPSQVSLNLPKLKKVNKNTDPHKIKLPKLKKIDKEEEISV